MTAREAIEEIKRDIAEVEWGYPISLRRRDLLECGVIKGQMQGECPYKE